jgi:DNA helicase-2/ATP-dependent DNA helicase PcrA
MTRAERNLYITHAVKRRVYGEELASEPSQFLNEMPLELIEDLSRGRSWLSFARRSQPLSEAGSLQYEYDEETPADNGEAFGVSNRLSARRPAGKYPGKTYDSVESVEEFFRKRNQQIGFQAQSPGPKVQGQGATGGAGKPRPDGRYATPQPFMPGSYVRHAKYGRGLVLRREGSGDQTKLTVSFPGYGAKKLVEKYAALEQG